MKNKPTRPCHVAGCDRPAKKRVHPIRYGKQSEHPVWVCDAHRMKHSRDNDRGRDSFDYSYRKKKWTPEQWELLKHLHFVLQQSVRTIASGMGMSPSTIQRRIQMLRQEREQ